MIFVQYKNARLDIMDKAKLKLYRTYRVALKLWNRRNPNVWAIPKKDTPESTEVMAIRKAPEKLEDTIKIKEKNSVKHKNPWLAFLAAHTKHDNESQTEFVKRMAKLYHSGGNKKDDKKADSDSESGSESESDKETKQKNFIQSKMATSVGVSIPVPEFKKEHKKLVKVLKTGTNKEQKKEAKEQQAELTTTIAPKAKAEVSAAKPKNAWLKFMASHEKNPGESQQKFLQRMAGLWALTKNKAGASKPAVASAVLKAETPVKAEKPVKAESPKPKEAFPYVVPKSESQEDFITAYNHNLKQLLKSYNDIAYWKKTTSKEKHQLFYLLADDRADKSLAAKHIIAALNRWLK
jgi:negative regulator of replication initiation